MSECALYNDFDPTLSTFYAYWRAFSSHSYYQLPILEMALPFVAKKVTYQKSIFETKH